MEVLVLLLCILGVGIICFNLYCILSIKKKVGKMEKDIATLLLLMTDDKKSQRLIKEFLEFLREKK